MAAFSSFGFDESTQELLRRGAALTEMLKQQQYKPLTSDVQVFVLFNGIREKITPKQLRFYEYQVVPNLLFGLKNANTLKTIENFPVNISTLPLRLFAVTEKLCNSSGAQGNAAHHTAPAPAEDHRRSRAADGLAGYGDRHDHHLPGHHAVWRR